MPRLPAHVALKNADVKRTLSGRASCPGGLLDAIAAGKGGGELIGDVGSSIGRVHSLLHPLDPVRHDA